LSSCVLIRTGFSQKGAHERSQIRFLRPQVEVNMVDHHAVGPDFDPEDFGKMNHPVQKKLFVRVCLEDGKPGIAPADDMIAGAGIFDAQRSSLNNS
jgi:hypothetical protein